jgi:hypothetical protein
LLRAAALHVSLCLAVPVFLLLSLAVCADFYNPTSFAYSFMFFFASLTFVSLCQACPLFLKGFAELCCAELAMFLLLIVGDVVISVPP